MKKASTLLLAFLTLVLAGLFTYTVYATLTATISFSNRITFVAQDISFKAVVKIVNPENESVVLFQGVINRSGDDYQTDINPITGYVDANFGDAITFSQEHPTIRYLITIENFSDFPISASFRLPNIFGTDSEYITNISRINNVTILGKTEQLRYSQVLQMDTTCLKFTKSFAIDNSFVVSINQIN